MLTYDLHTDMSFEEIAETWQLNENEELATLLGLPTQNISEAISGEVEGVYATQSEIYRDNEPVPLRPHAKAALESFEMH